MDVKQKFDEWMNEFHHMNLTTDSEVVGTPYYIPPEALQAAGFTPENCRAMSSRYEAEHGEDDVWDDTVGFRDSTLDLQTDYPPVNYSDFYS